MVDDRERFKGVFGEREFVTALFPGYVGQLKGAAFLRGSLDAALEKRNACRFDAVGKHMNTEHVEVGSDHSELQVAEIFLHHRVLIVPGGRRRQGGRRDRAARLLPRRRGTLPGRSVTDRIREFLHDEAAGGLAILVATIVALVWANVAASTTTGSGTPSSARSTCTTGSTTG